MYRLAHALCMGDAQLKTRVATFLPDIKYIEYMRGKQGLVELIQNLEAKGIPFKNIVESRISSWVPVYVKKEFLKTIKEVFSWDDKRIYLMGVQAAQESPIVKFYLHNRMKMNETLRIAANMWKEHNSGGNLRVEHVADGHAKIILEEFDICPGYCRYLEGYMQGIVNSTTAREGTVNETRCRFRGDPYHEYTIQWKD